MANFRSRKSRVFNELSRRYINNSRRAAEIYADSIKAESPVESGELRDSISFDDEQISIEAPYAARIQFGFFDVDSLGRSYNQPPNPFVTRGINRGFERANEALTNE